MEEKLKKVARFLQVAIRFHPDHPWPKALIYSFSAQISSFKQDWTIILGFHQYKHVFWLLKLIPKISDVAPSIRSQVTTQKTTSPALNTDELLLTILRKSSI